MFDLRSSWKVCIKHGIKIPRAHIHIYKRVFEIPLLKMQVFGMLRRVLAQTDTDVRKVPQSFETQGTPSLTFKRRIKSRLPFAGIIRSSPYSPRFQDKG